MTNLATRAERGDDAGELLREFRKYRPGDCIPTYHNMCGRRTTYLPCRCRHCRSLQAANMLRGSCDTAPLVQAFARHRTRKYFILTE